MNDQSENDNPGVGEANGMQCAVLLPHVDPAPGLSGSGDTMSSLCWFPFYPADWLGSLTVRGMTPAQKGYYIELLCHQWNEGGTLPDDPSFLAAACGAKDDCPDFRVALSKFPLGGSGRRWNKRLVEIWEKQSQKHSNRVSSGSSRKKIQNQNQNQIAEAKLEQCSSNARTDFAEAWNLYPEKSGKQKALVAYLKWRKEGDLQSDVLAGITRYIAYVESRRKCGFKDLKYQNGQTFFHGRGWSSEWVSVTPAKAAPVDPLAGKKRFLDSASPRDRWAIIISGRTNMESAELEAYAKTLPGGVIKP